MGGISIPRIFQPAADHFSDLLQFGLNGKVLVVFDALRILRNTKKDFCYIQVSTRFFQTANFLRSGTVSGPQCVFEHLEQDFVTTVAQRIAFRFWKSRLDLRPEQVKIRQDMDNRNIKQLSFGFGYSLGGGRYWRRDAA